MATLSIIRASSALIQLAIAPKYGAAANAAGEAWTNAAGELYLIPLSFYGMRVQRSTDAAFTGNLVEFDVDFETIYDSHALPPLASTTYFYRVKAKDAAGALEADWSNTASATVVIRLPVVQITSPSARAEVSGVTNFSGVITSDLPIAVIQIYLDSQPFGAEITGGDLTLFSAAVDTTALPNNTHTFLVIARDIAGNRAGASVDFNVYNVPVINNLFVWDGVRRPEYYDAPPRDFAKVRRSHEYEDGGMTFNKLNSNAPQTWEMRYTHVPPRSSRIFRDHFDRCDIADTFSFKAKNGVTYDNVRYKTFEPSHEGRQSWEETINIVLIRYP